tara:strand:- start:181009 stop:181410 length:402 start_codon:yes stop_codon:yes gene_type:complete
MVKIFFVTLFVAALVVIHDYIVSHNLATGFELSELGWMIHTYLPGVEAALIRDIPLEMRQTYLAPVFETKTVKIVGYIGGYLLLFTAILKMIRGNSFLPEFMKRRIETKKMEKSPYGRHRYAKHKPIKYKRKD